jgi:uncharacterized membrane protein
MRYAAAYLTTGIVMALLDLIWLRTISNGFFRAQVGPLLTDDPNAVAAVLFYLFFAAGIVFFAIMPGLKAMSLTTAAVQGAALGFIAYMTFDLTCLAILKGWTLPATLVDITWGTFVSAVATSAGYYAGNFFTPR